MCERGQRSLVCSHAVLQPSTQNILWFCETDYWVSFDDKDTQQFSFLKPLEFYWIPTNGWRKFEKNQCRWAQCVKGRKCSSYVSYQNLANCVWLFLILLKGPRKTSPPNLKSWLIAMRKIQTQKNKSLSKGLVTFIQLLQEKERLQTGIAWH